MFSSSSPFHEEQQTVLVGHGGLTAWLAGAHPLTLHPQYIRRKKKKSWKELTGGKKEGISPTNYSCR